MANIEHHFFCLRASLAYNLYRAELSTVSLLELGGMVAADD